MSAKKQSQKSTNTTDSENKVLKKLLRLKKDDLAQALASFPTHDVEAVLNERLGPDRSITLTEGQTKRAERRRLFQKAKAVFNNRMSVVDCTIRNRSERGYLVETKNSISIPGYFELDIPSTGKRVPVQVMWRNGAQMGLAIND